jgi:hypothetical protein
MSILRERGAGVRSRFRETAVRTVPWVTVFFEAICLFALVATASRVSLLRSVIYAEAIDGRCLPLGLPGRAVDALVEPLGPGNLLPMRTVIAGTVSVNRFARSTSASSGEKRLPVA